MKRSKFSAQLVRSYCARRRKARGSRGGLPEARDLAVDLLPLVQEVWESDAIGKAAFEVAGREERAFEAFGSCGGRGVGIVRENWLEQESKLS